MLKYIVKRLLLGCLVLFGVITITFILCRVVPSDPVSKVVGTRATPEQREQARIEMGLDKPLTTQYVLYLNDLLHGDLGTSLRTKQPVTNELREYIPSAGHQFCQEKGSAAGSFLPVLFRGRCFAADLLDGAVSAVDILPTAELASAGRTDRRHADADTGCAAEDRLYAAGLYSCR